MAEMIDLSGIGTFIPVFGFLLVFVVVYALLSKTKLLGENKFVHIFTSFVVAILFLASTNAIKYVASITPWFVAFVVSLIFIGLVVGLMGKETLEKVFTPAFGWFIVVVLTIVFIASAAFIFKDLIMGPVTLPPATVGIIILIAITIFASWLITKGK